MPSTALGQVVASHATSLPVARSSTLVEPGIWTAPTLSMTLDVAGSMARTPVSPQSMFNGAATGREHVTRALLVEVDLVRRPELHAGLRRSRAPRTSPRC